jgi:hypothetical protein
MLSSITPLVARPLDAVTVTMPFFTTYRPDMRLPSSSMLICSFITTIPSMLRPFQRSGSMVMLATRGKTLALGATGLTVTKDEVRSPTEAAHEPLCR